MRWVLIVVHLLPQQDTPSDSFDRLRQVYFALFGLKVPVRNEGFAAQALAAVGRKVWSPVSVLWCGQEQACSRTSHTGCAHHRHVPDGRHA